MSKYRLSDFEDYYFKKRPDDSVKKELSSLDWDLRYSEFPKRFNKKIMHIVPDALNKNYLLPYHCARTFVYSFANIHHKDYSFLPKIIWLDGRTNSVSTTLTILIGHIKSLKLDDHCQGQAYSIIIDYTHTDEIPKPDREQLEKSIEIDNLLIIIRSSFNPFTSYSSDCDSLQLLRPVQKMSHLSEWRLNSESSDGAVHAKNIIKSFIEVAETFKDEEVKFELFKLILNCQVPSKSLAFMSFYSICEYSDSRMPIIKLLKGMRYLLLEDWALGGQSSNFFQGMIGGVNKERCINELNDSLSSPDYNHILGPEEVNRSFAPPLFKQFAYNTFGYMGVRRFYNY